MSTPEVQIMADTGLDRIAYLSAHNVDQEFTSLMHHVNVESLRRCYQRLDGKKAVGVDGISKAHFGENLIASLKELIAKMKSMSYRPGPVGEVRIPKEGKSGATRSLGISNLLDKLVQKRFQEILEAIYEPIFLDCSYGFRPSRSCHDAIKALREHLHENEVETVLDVDLSNFFGMIDQNLLVEQLERKIKDPLFIRYIRRMFKSGLLADGELIYREEGVVQGSCCSPVLANIYAHYVIDEWIECVVKRNCEQSSVQMYRYADDIVMVCRYEKDAHRIKESLGKRLAKYGLKMNEEKTKLVKFSKSQSAKGIQQETFDFLGFTFYIGRSKGGKVLVKLKTCGKRFRSKLKKVNEWARGNRSRYKLDELWERFIARMRGHIEYFGVSFNMKAVSKYVQESTRITFKWLNRRSQRRSFTWEEFTQLLERSPLPEVLIKHRLFWNDIKK